MSALSLKSMLACVAVSALAFNSVWAYTLLDGSGTQGGWLGGPSDGDAQNLGDLTVKMPAFKLYDLATYDYHVYAESFYMNMTSGNWSNNTLTIDGQMKRAYSGINDANDGYMVPHSSVEHDIDTTAAFVVVFASSDGDPLTVEGNLEIQRKEFIELNARRPVKTYTEAALEVRGLPQMDKPLTFTGIADSYPDPNRELDKSVDSTIFPEGAVLKRGDNGTFVIQTVYEQDDFVIGTRYNWTASAVQMVSGLKALKIDIAADMFGQEGQNASESWFWFNETVWVSNDCPFPVKRYSLTNENYTDTQRNTVSRIVLEVSSTIIKNGYTKGSAAIPWGDPSGTEFAKRHPKGEFLDWQVNPQDGAGLAGSSFQFGLDEAVAEARKNSSGLKEFFGKYDMPGRAVKVDWASSNATVDQTDVNGKAGLYRWNMTFSVVPTRAEYMQARQNNDYNFSYSIVVVDDVTKEMDRLRMVYKDNVHIEHDWGPVRGSSSMSREAMDPEGLTLASSEEILLLDPTVSQAVKNPLTGSIDWKESTYSLGVAGLGGGGAGFQMLETLTGITFPTADHAWAIQTQTVYEQGHTTMAAVDVETGRLVFVTDIQGTVLLGLFG